MRFKILKNLKHSGTYFVPGQEAEFPDDEATKELLDMGVLEPIEEPKPEPAVEPKEEEIKKPEIKTKKTGRKKRK